MVRTSYGWYFPTLKPITGALKIPVTGSKSDIYFSDRPTGIEVKGNAGEQLHDKLNSEGIRHEFYTHVGEGHSWSYWFNVVGNQFQFFSTKFK